LKIILYEKKIITDDMLIDAAMNSKSIMGVLRFWE